MMLVLEMEHMPHLNRGPYCVILRVPIMPLSSHGLYYAKIEGEAYASNAKSKPGAYQLYSAYKEGRIGLMAYSLL